MSFPSAGWTFTIRSGRVGWSLCMLFFVLLCIKGRLVAWECKNRHSAYLSYLYYNLLISPNNGSQNDGWWICWLGSSLVLLDLPFAWLGSEICLACCGIPYVIHLHLVWVCNVTLWTYGFTGDKSCKICIDSWQCLVVLRWPWAVDRTLKSSY